MRLTLELPDPDGVIRVKCVGKITQASFEGKTDPFVDLLGPGGHGRNIRLDLARVDYIDSSGIGWLVGSHKRFKEAGGQLLLCQLPPVVEQVLRFCALDTILTIERD